jgi:hypothetical protein
MIDIDDIRDSLQDQIAAGGKELAKIKDEMKRLRAAHHRYLDLLERAKSTEERKGYWRPRTCFMKTATQTQKALRISLPSVAYMWNQSLVKSITYGWQCEKLFAKYRKSRLSNWNCFCGT